MANAINVASLGAHVEYVDGTDAANAIKVASLIAQVEHVGGSGEVPRLQVAQLTAQVETVGGSDSLQAIKIANLGAHIEYRETLPSGTLPQYKPRILIEFLFGDFGRYSTEDLYIDELGLINYYERRLMESPTIRKSMTNQFYGRAKTSDVTISLSNHDGFWTTFCANYELREQRIRVRRYDPGELTGTDVLTLEMVGSIQSYDLTLEKIDITISEGETELLQKLIPQKVYETTDWSAGTNGTTITNPPDDLGKPYSVCFGYSFRVPCRYVLRDTVNDYYDYIIGYGPIESCDKVYRDGVEVLSTEYTFYDGSQASPYPGYAFIRFILEQRGFNQQMYSLTADIKGLKLGTSAAVRNFATVIKYLLINSTWGLDQSVNDASFIAAATDCTNYLCDGFISEQRRAIEILDDLLLACHGKLSRNEDGEWILDIDKSVSTTSGGFGFNDNYYDNIMTINNFYKTPLSEAVKKIEINYWWDEWGNKLAVQNDRDVLSCGQLVSYENPFIRSHETADRVLCYIEQKLEMNDTRLEIEVGMEGRMLNLRDTVIIAIPDLSISDTFQVEEIERDLTTFKLSLVKYNTSIFTYNVGTLPDDPIDPDTPDYQNPDAPSYEAPIAPTTGGGLDPPGWMFSVDGTGKVYVSFEGYVMKPTITNNNFAKIQAGWRINGGGSSYHWQDMYEYDAATGEWRTVLTVPASNVNTTFYYDFAARCVNAFGRCSALREWLHEDVPYKSTAPSDVTGLTAGNLYKTVTFTWTHLTDSDMKGGDYHIQIDDTSDYSSPLVDKYIPNTSYSYTVSIAYGATIYVRVKARNTSEVESVNWTNASHVIATTDYLPDDSVGQSALNANCAGNGLAQDSSGAMYINTDGTSIVVSADAIAINSSWTIGEARINFVSSVSTNALPANPTGYVTIDGKKFYFYT